MSEPAWREGHGRLAARVARIPEVLRGIDPTLPPAPFDPREVGCICVTGLGSSAAHARFLAALLVERAGVPARFVPTGALLSGASAGAERDALVVFSQGLSPNARLALARPRAWRHLVLLTPEDSRAQERRRALAALRSAGVCVWHVPGADEDGLLLRVVGPAAGFVRAAQLAASLGAEIRVDPAALADAAARAAARALTACVALPDETFGQELLLVATGAQAELADHLRLKLLEGLQRPVPPVCEILELTHGPFQAIAERPATLVALTHTGDRAGEALLSRLESLLDEDRHHLVTFRAEQPGPLAIVEHEVALDVFVLRGIERLGIDPSRWPGRGREGPLYELTAPLDVSRPRAPARAGGRLDELVWTEIASHLERRPRVAVIPLGSTEQHGPHLPLATDTWIAEALAARFCARVQGALALPALAFGCASEHLAFAGTLHLAPETLRAVLADLVRSLDHHGFDDVFCFSAHGGNLALLREATPALVRSARARVVVFGDHGRLGRVLAGVAARHGIAPEVAGLHAGELETSLVAYLRPGAVRQAALAPGLLAPPADADALFDEGLRARAPSGTVGDPRPASPGRAAAYLDAWADVLVAAFWEARKRQATNGTKRP